MAIAPLVAVVIVRPVEFSGPTAGLKSLQNKRNVELLWTDLSLLHGLTCVRKCACAARSLRMSNFLQSRICTLHSRLVPTLPGCKRMAVLMRSRG